MAFAPTSSRQDALSQMNITPLVSVMLVILVIFMLAVPMSSRPVPLDISYGCGWDTEAPEPLRVRIDASNSVFVDDQSTPMSALRTAFETAQTDPRQPSVSLQMDVDGDADYQTVARVIAAGLDAGLVGVGFVND